MSLSKLKAPNNINIESSLTEGSDLLLSSRRQKVIKVSEKLMTIIGLCGQSLFYFQAYKVYSMGSANDVSTTGFSFALFSLVSWLFYGILIKNKVLIIVNAFAVIGASLTLLAIFLVS